MAALRRLEIDSNSKRDGVGEVVAELLENLTFSTSEDGAGGGLLAPLNAEQSKEAAEWLCSKEEVAARAAIVTAAETTGEEYELLGQKIPYGTPFTDEELAEKACTVLQALE